MFDGDYTITGKHATYLKYLAAKNARDDEDGATSSAKIFERYIDVYMNAAIWGLLYSRTAPKDNTSDSRARIYADAFSKERDNCVFLYRMVMLLDKTSEIDSTERVNRTFRYDSDKEKEAEFQNNLELFNSYVRGGIEQMYEEFTSGCSTRDDYLNKVYEIMTDFKNEIEGHSYEDDLAALLR